MVYCQASSGVRDAPKVIMAPGFYITFTVSLCDAFEKLELGLGCLVGNTCKHDLNRWLRLLRICIC